jgi:hypothetical protein
MEKSRFIVPFITGPKNLKIWFFSLHTRCLTSSSCIKYKKKCLKAFFLSLFWSAMQWRDRLLTQDILMVPTVFTGLTDRLELSVSRRNPFSCRTPLGRYSGH